MPEQCHRCGADLDGATGSFCCPHCGSPQLSIAPAMTEAEGLEDGSTTGNAPPPRPPSILWRSALRSGLAVALVGAVLFVLASYIPALTIFSLLWILGGASIATGLYRRGHPSLPMDAAIGARIGLSVGLLMTTCLAVAVAGIGLVARFVLHSMAAFDAEMTQRMHDQVQRTIAANPASAEMVQQMLSQEFRTGVMIAGLLIFGFFILALSTLSGLLSGLVAVGRNRTA